MSVCALWVNPAHMYGQNRRNDRRHQKVNVFHCATCCPELTVDGSGALRERNVKTGEGPSDEEKQLGAGVTGFLFATDSQRVVFTYFIYSTFGKCKSKLESYWIQNAIECYPLLDIITCRPIEFFHSIGVAADACGVLRPEMKVVRHEMITSSFIEIVVYIDYDY